MNTSTCTLEVDSSVCIILHVLVNLPMIMNTCEFEINNRAST